VTVLVSFLVLVIVFCWVLVEVGGVSVIVSVLVIVLADSVEGTVLVLVLTGRFLVIVVVFCGKTTGKGVIV